MPLVQLYVFNVFKLIQFFRENGNTTQKQLLSAPVLPTEADHLG